PAGPLRFTRSAGRLDWAMAGPPTLASGPPARPLRYIRPAGLLDWAMAGPPTPLRQWTGEDSNLRSPQGAADLQSAAINRSATCPLFDATSWRRDLNPRPADYKSAALPTELRQH